MKYTEGPFASLPQAENRIAELQFSDEGINYRFRPKQVKQSWFLEGVKVTFG